LVRWFVVAVSLFWPAVIAQAAAPPRLELLLPREGLSERVEVSEPDDTSNRRNATTCKKVVERINTFK
jgi:hypothetical protein